MTPRALLAIAVYVAVLLALAAPLGLYMARVYRAEADVAARVFGPVERALYRLAGVDPEEDMTWQRYGFALLGFNLLGLLALYLLQRLQGALPLNPRGLGAVGPELALNTAVSFATNTNWQAYAGETTLSHFTQLVGLTVQNFVSAATGMAVLVALTRGFSRRGANGVGSFWVDLTRSTLYVLLPLSLVLALVLASQGVVQTLEGAFRVALLDPAAQAHEQWIAVGPVASQEAIKQLGSNGGGFFNVNSAHPFENPTPLTNFLEVVSILLIPAASCFTFGKLVGDGRQGRALLLAMLVLLVPLMGAAVAAEQAGNPALSALGVDALPSTLSGGGNLEGKELRFGSADSAIWSVATTAASNGSVNAMHDSFTPLGGLVPMALIQLGEVVFGGVGSGLYGMIAYAIVAVFISGLMVGRTPEYLGKKIEAFEMKMVSLVILLPAASALLGTAVASALDTGRAAVANPGAHGFSEILYAFSSGANNNGSAFAGLTASGTFYTLAIALVMAVGRYWVIVPVLALAGALAKKKLVPTSAGTLPTHDALFIGLLAGTVLLVGALSFVPALALGPIVEHLSQR